MGIPSTSRRLALPLGLALASIAAHACADPQRYELDPVHTRVTFAVSHADFSSAIGSVSGSTGTLHFDPDDWTTARVEVNVPVHRLDLGDEPWNRATLARNLLDAEGHPLVRFVSTAVEPLEDGRGRIKGLLTLRGETREVVLEATLNALKRHPLPPFRRTAGFSATTTLSRSDFGITAWRSMIGDEVELRIEVEAVRARGDTDAVDGDAAAGPGEPGGRPQDRDEAGAQAEVVPPVTEEPHR